MKRLIQTLREFPEILALPMAGLLFWFAPRLIRLLDSSAGEIDSGILQFFFLAICWVLLVNPLVFLGIKFNFKSLYQCYKDGFPDSSSFWQFFAVYALLMLTFSLALIAIV